MSNIDDRPQGLLAWQWENYSPAHQDRRNLALHIASNPIFLLGNLAIPAALVAGPWFAVGGFAAMVFAMALQGRGHKLEVNPPPPFRGPGDVIARIFAEQWVIFPRFVLSGGWARAWKAAAPARA